MVANITAPTTSMKISDMLKFRSMNSRLSNSGARAVLRWMTAIHAPLTVQPSQMRITLRAQLVSLQDNRVLATQLFDVRETAASEDAYGGVQAANSATARLLLQLADFCKSRTAR